MSSRQPRRNSRVLWLAGVGLGLGLLLAGAAAALLAGWQRPWLTRQAASVLSSVLGTQVTLGSLRGRLIDGFEVRDFRSLDAQGRALEIARIDGRVDPIAWLTDGVVQVERLVLVGATVSVRPSEPSRFRVDGLGRPEPAESGPSQAGGWRLRVASLAVRQSRLRWQTDGELGPASASLQLEAHARDWALTSERPWHPPAAFGLSSEIQVESKAGDVLATGTARVSGEGPRLRAELDFTGVLGRATGEATAQLLGGVLAQATANLQLESLDLAALLGDSRLPNGLSGPVAVRALDDRADTIGVEARLRDAGPGTAAADEISLAGRVEPATLAWQLERLQLSGRAGALEATGAGSAEGLESLSVRATAIDLTTLPAGWTRGETRGRVSGEVDLTGPWSALVLAGSLHTEAVTWRQWLVGRVELRGRAEAGSNRFDVQQLVVEGPAGRLDASLRGTAARIEALELTRASLRVAALPEVWRERLPFDTGRLEAEGSLAGPPSDLSGTFRIAGEGLQLPSGPPLSFRVTGLANGAGRISLTQAELRAGDLHAVASAPAELHFAADELQVEGLRLAWGGGGALGIDGSVHRSGQHDVQLSLERLDWAQLTAWLPNAPDSGGTVTAQLHSRGLPAAPELSGALAWEAARLRDLRDLRAEGVYAEFYVEDERLRLTARVLQPDRRHLDVRGSLRWALWGQPGRWLRDSGSDVRVRGDAIDFGWLCALTPLAPLRPEGALTADVTLRGDAAGPLVHGRLRLEEAFLTPPEFDQRIGPVSGRVRLTGRAAEVRGFEIRAGEGSARIDGDATWGGREPPWVDLEAQALGFELNRGDLASGLLDGAIRLQGHADALAATGTATLRQVRARLPEPDDPLWKEIRVRGLPDAETASALLEGTNRVPPWLRPVALDLTLEVAPDAWVQGQGADLTLSGRFDLLKRPHEPPLATGLLEVVRGTVRYQGRTFDVERGAVRLTGEPGFDPELDIVAAYPVRDVVLRISVQGTRKQPILSLESDPPLDPTDMLSYLAFGRPASELDARSDQNLAATAGRVAGQVLLSELGTSLSDEPLLDELDVAAEPETGDTSVRVGKRVGRDVFVRYVRTFGESSADRVRVEWRFLPRFSLESEIGTDGRTGADLLFTVDY